jgi:hypothetical protein
MKEGRKRAKRAAQNLLRRAKRSTSNNLYIASRCGAPCGAKSKAKPQQEQQQNVAIFHLHAQVIKRSEGRSSVAAAHRLGVAVEDPQTGLRHDFSRKGGVSVADACPDNAPAWASDPAQLWVNVETIEKRKTLTLPRVRHCPAPRTDPQQCATLARAFVQKSSLTGACVQRLLSITSVETTPFPPDDHDARH